MYVEIVLPITELSVENVDILVVLANKLTILLTQAQIDLNTATIAQEAAQAEYDVASAALEAAIESGSTCARVPARVQARQRRHYR